MGLLAHRELVAGLVISVLIFFPFYGVLRWERLRIASLSSVRLFFVVWAAMFTVEYFVFGPYSFVAVDTDSRNLAFLHYLARLHDGGLFAHDIAGGQDLGIILPGTQYLMPERTLLRFLDPWVVLLVHKLMIAILAFTGAYLLARSLVKGVDRFAATAAAAVFPVSHMYLGNYSLEFGTGFAAIPLAVYAAVVCVERKNFAAWVFGAGIVLALAQPMKVFPATLVATLCVLFVFERRNLTRTAAAFAFYIMLSVLNWHEILYGIILLVGETTRGFGAVADMIDVTGSVAKVFRLFFFNWLPYNLFISTLLAVSIAVLIAKRDKLGFRALAAVFLFVAAFLAVDLFPWQWVGLAFINRVENVYMWMAVPVLAVPIAAKAVSAGPEGLSQTPGAGWNRRAGALLAAALCLLTWNKILNAAWFTALGGQGTSFGLAELKKPQWRTDQGFRAITLFEIPPTNVAASFYGLDSFDGAMLLNPKRWNDYWSSIKKRPLSSSRTATRASLDWSHWDGRTYDIDAALRLDLLSVANVKYIVSPLPLSGAGLTPIVTAEKSDWAKTRPGFFESRVEYVKARFRRIFDPGRLFVYALADPLPRIFAASSLEVVPDDLDRIAVHDRVAAVAGRGRVVVARRHAGKLKGLGKLTVQSYKKAVDGYDIIVGAEQGGIVVVNNAYLPFWRATADGKPLEIVPANGVHMAVAVPAGARKVEVRYRRPMLKDKFRAFPGPPPPDHQ